MEKYLIKCENCGAMIEPLDAKCPHCGALNAVGGEFQYMDDLMEIREGVNNLSENQKDAYKTEVKKTFGLMGKTAIVVISIAVILILLFWGSTKIFERLGGYNKSTADIVDQMKWEQETYPMLDELYENGDYDALCDFEEDNILNSKYSMSSWPHYMWLLAYNNYRYLLQQAEWIKAGDYKESDIKYCLKDMVRLVCNQDTRTWDEKDIEILKDCQDELIEKVLPVLEISEDELREIYESCVEHESYGDNMSYDKLEKAAKKFAKDYMKSHK